MKGILFKPEMIKAIMEGRKTVTRRIIKLPQINSEIKGLRQHGDEWLMVVDDDICIGNIKDRIASRYQVGDIVYVKETWSSDCTCGNPVCNGVIYKLGYAGLTPSNECKWRSPLFLPEKYARTFLEIVSVRAERLNEITDKECYKEGCPEIKMRGADGELFNAVIPTFWYETLWDSINPDMPFSSNPWVLRYEFKRKVNL